MRKKLYTEKQIAKLLGVSPITVQRWEHQGKIPYKIIKNKVFFDKDEITKWAQEHEFNIEKATEVQSNVPNKNAYLGNAMERGGIYHAVPGEDVYSVLKNSLNVLPFLEGADKTLLLNELLNREELASTGIGHGIAIPHTRNRIDLNLSQAYVPILFTEKPISYNAIDNVPVFVLFMMFTTTTQEHLKLLSKISFVLQNHEVQTLLQEANVGDELLETIRLVEGEAE
ncbi:MAG: PTS sugar transporter subunit IIA [Deferribacteres bacterium]|nr:PTS sugar transporter subunit IIA [candidate division KSB1 bacterium]MCB9500745.1 PTS sugar transporter subunit IIA [Deferribacteres bacterium]